MAHCVGPALGGVLTSSPLHGAEHLFHDGIVECEEQDVMALMAYESENYRAYRGVSTGLSSSEPLRDHAQGIPRSPVVCPANPARERSTRRFSYAGEHRVSLIVGYRHGFPTPIPRVYSHLHSVSATITGHPGRACRRASASPQFPAALAAVAGLTRDAGDASALVPKCAPVPG